MLQVSLISNRPARSVTVTMPPGGPVLGIVDARDNRWLANIPTGAHAHSVAANPIDGRVFVPIAATDAESGCHDGCIAVFAAPSTRRAN